MPLILFHSAFQQWPPLSLAQAVLWFLQWREWSIWLSSYLPVGHCFAWQIRVQRSNISYQYCKPSVNWGKPYLVMWAPIIMMHYRRLWATMNWSLYFRSTHHTRYCQIVLGPVNIWPVISSVCRYKIPGLRFAMKCYNAGYIILPDSARSR